MSDIEDLRMRIDNAVTVLRAQANTARGNDLQGLRLALETLQAARAGIDELAEQLDLVTAPELDAAAEIQRMRGELAAAQDRAARVEQELAMLRQEHEIEEHLHDEEKRRLQQLEKKTKDFEDLLATDKGAFGAFMDKALDDQSPKKRKPKG